MSGAVDLSRSGHCMCCNIKAIKYCIYCDISGVSVDIIYLLVSILSLIIL